MTLPDKNRLKDGLETIEINDLDYPESLDRIVGPKKGGENDEQDFGTWIEDALKWDEEPRRAVLIEDYWNLDPEIEEEISSAINSSMDYPGLEGGKLAGAAIEVMEEMSEGSFSTIIGFSLDRLKDDQNPYQMMAPQGVDSLVDVPEWYPGDDWFTELEEDEYVGVITDDKTAYARQIADNIKRNPDNRDIDAQFWKAYQETIENYVGI